MDNFHVNCLSQDPRAATKDLLNKILTEIHPQVIKTRNRIQSCKETEDTLKIRDVYTLCLSQIKKSLLSLFEVFRQEFNNQISLQESRQCILERLSWCFNRLVALDTHLERVQSNEESSDDSFNVTVMYFVNWIDHAFDVLGKLSEVVYNTSYKDNMQLFDEWKNEMVECVSGLHLSIDELLLSAMTLCRYCLPSDQLVVKARSQVVLRETKALLSELIEGDLSTIKATAEALKLPIMPSNVNVMIDVLKDVLYILETNTNTALLTLLVHCFSNNKSPVEILKEHIICTKGECSCVKSTEDCMFVKEFDMYNERLLQIGSFAVSCSSDQNRILTLRSGLASLEALDPHLVPALLTSPLSTHATLLVSSWRQEVQDIRDNVFLIVDPAAFADKAKQMMHQKIVEVLKEPVYNNNNVCEVINIGSVVHDFFDVYNKLEPDALSQHEKLIPLLADINKVQIECKIVSNLFCTANDFTYDVPKPKQKEATLEQLNKRLKLLYTLITRINTLLQPEDNDQLFENDDEVKNATHTIVKNGQTYIQSKKVNISRSIFARTNVRSSTRNFPLAKLTKHLRNNSELNFSVELDRLFNISSENGVNNNLNNKYLSKVRESSVLYNFSPINNRVSMRKAVLSRHLSTFKEDRKQGDNVQMESLMNENESLQLTEVLNEMNNMTSFVSGKTQVLNKTHSKSEEPNILRINVNQNTTITKRIWNIPVSSETLEVSSVSSTQPSTITTLERINDLDFVESKLYSLKTQFETSL